MLLDGFISVLSADATVAGLVAARIYKSVLPRATPLPAIVVHRYDGAQEYQFSGPADIREDKLQLDIYGTGGSCQTISEAARRVLYKFVGVLPEGTVVQGCFLERSLDMPFLANADGKGIADRTTLGFRVVSINT